jgi:hypothetical protein
MGLGEKEDELRLRQVPHFGQVLKQFRQHPQQHRAVNLGGLKQLIRGKNVDHAPPLGIGLQEGREVEGRLPEKRGATL